MHSNTAHEGLLECPRNLDDYPSGPHKAHKDRKMIDGIPLLRRQHGTNPDDARVCLALPHVMFQMAPRQAPDK
eukprot:588249-Pyramimonas_sp.AAC.1